ncbi:hypothetical protein FIBSPDRAFT_230316 [Athelia psychrophila]|uniref:Uncharacterized protein n=1 Tax=Athelia psychrophila TaxID=1759441 RepID=A0A165YQ32_9AGAM|nr:hypothetical protein FIBSPDRAFT_230316 [Fibularhizoctonia sp. CBS 109695]
MRRVLSACPHSCRSCPHRCLCSGSLPPVPRSPGGDGRNADDADEGDALVEVEVIMVVGRGRAGGGSALVRVARYLTPMVFLSFLPCMGRFLPHDHIPT